MEKHRLFSCIVLMSASLALPAVVIGTAAATLTGCTPGGYNHMGVNPPDPDPVDLGIDGSYNHMGYVPDAAAPALDAGLDADTDGGSVP